ncbi:hypothetical protein [Pedobacter frigoris]|uniref:hypothetical protein n=1 Tax=Pedobacter frigoris TaxID=2571272 RepID=UPI00292E4397|nr:hypothetical protein [Pedobacter frigoris]
MLQGEDGTAFTKIFSRAISIVGVCLDVYLPGDFINGTNGRVDYDVADFPLLVELQAMSRQIW